MSLPVLRARRLGIDTYREPVVYMRPDCHVCRSEGFEARSRVLVWAERGGAAVATVNVVLSDLLAEGEAGLSEEAWRRLDVRAGEALHLSHAPTLESFGSVRGKMHGRRLDRLDFDAIVRDIAAGSYSDVHLSSFLTACAGQNMDLEEVVALTEAMVFAGDCLDWGVPVVVDKHCIGGLPGNRTTPIVVAIAAAAGLTMPKTSSRAITSPAGTADVMEVLTTVDLGLTRLQEVVREHGACLAWGGSVRLSPADDLLIRIERALDIDGEGQLVASVLSKKAAAGSTHVLIDIPWGPTAKVRTRSAATSLAETFVAVGERLGLVVETVLSDGTQPVGRGVGPALEARDVLAVLRRASGAPSDLRARSLALAGRVLELGGACARGAGLDGARELLDSGAALSRFTSICRAQGGLAEPGQASLFAHVLSRAAGQVRRIDNRRLARAAKLAGAPRAALAGIELHVRLGDSVEPEQPLFTLYAESPGELAYARDYVDRHPHIVSVEPTAPAEA